MKTKEDLSIKIFADGADKKGILEMLNNPLISGFTTNPSLMRKAGITDYEKFALDITQAINNKPISFEVFSDDLDEMYEQALKIAQWGKNVYVKIPVTNTKKQSTCELIKQLARSGVKQNITAIMTLDQVRDVTNALAEGPAAYVSVFAGRIADTGRDPIPTMTQALEILQPYPQLELLWASTRELFNIIQANNIGCHIITVPNDIIKKMSHIGKNLDEHSLETVKLFYDDAISANFSLTLDKPLSTVNT